MSFDSGTLIIDEDGVLTDRTNIIHDDTAFNFDNTRGRRGTSSIPLMIDAEVVYLPKIGWPVFLNEVYQGSPVTTEAAFVGVVSAFDWEYFNDQGDRVVTLTVVTLEKYFDTVQTPAADYTGMNAGAIFTSIFNAVIGLLPSAPVITLGTIDAGVSISDRSYTGTSNAAADFQQLATDSAYIWYIDPRDLKVYFHAHDTRPAAFTVVSDMVYTDSGKSSIKWTVSDSDFVSRQLIQQVQGAGTAAAPSKQTLFLGDGTTTTFTLPQIVSAVQAAFLSTGSAATSTGTFTGQPSDGDTITIVPAIGPTLVYTFKAALDNTVAKQILIGATLADTVQNLADGINAFPGATGYSAPTTRNGAIAASATSGTTILVGSLPLGPSTTTIVATGSVLTWSDSPLAGGTQSGTVQISCGVDGSGQFQLVYTPGSAVVTLLTAPPVGVHLTVMFQDPVPGLLTTSNDQASTLGVAGQFRQIASNASVDQETAIQQAAARLAAYSVLPKVFSFISDTPGLFVGGYVTVALTDPAVAAAVLNGQWLIQDVRGDWIAGAELNEPPFLCHFRYTYTLINTTEISTYQDTLAALLNTGPFVLPPAAQPVPNATTSPTDSSGGTGGGGSTMTAGQQWVQEQLGFAILQSGDDLVAVTSTTVSSASYTFVSDDIGRLLDIVTAAGWTPGLYLITGVTAGVATLGSSPATGGATGGKWGTADTHVFQFTWAPGVSFWTANQIAIVTKLKGNGDSPLTFVAQQLTPFDYAEVGYATSGTGPGGSDYVISGDQLTVRDPLSDNEFLLVEYFPDKPEKLPHKQAGDVPPGGAQFVIANDDPDNAGNIIQTSPDGSSWTLQNTPLASSGSAVAHGNGTYVCGSNQFAATTQQIATSTDAITWTARSSPADTGGVTKLAFGGGVFVAIYGTFGSRLLMFSTDNGTSWSTSTIPSSVEWVDIAWSPDLSIFCAVSEDGSTMHSTNGATWTAGDTLAFAGICIAWGAGVFTTLGGNDNSSPGQHLATSTDGSAWTPQSDPAGNEYGYYACTFGGSQFVAVRGPVVGSGIIPSVSSSDGISWTSHDIGVNEQWQGVAFGSSLYVAIANVGDIASTPDGATWTPQTPAGGNTFRAICYG